MPNLTLPVSQAADGPLVRRFRLVVVEGPAAGRCFDAPADLCSVGSQEGAHLVIEDPTVSRFHCEIRMAADGVRVRDLGSRNGTLVDGVQVAEAFLRTGSLVRLGRTVVRFEFVADATRLLLSEQTRFGRLVGNSAAMRATFALLERAARTDATVLLEGETGTGKGQAALGLHREGSRRDASFVVVDCGAIPAALLESELFGHEKGSFTGAVARRMGAFEEASGGTVFLDEVGELPADLQPKLLRVLEDREIRPVGGTARRVDVRVVAATHRDLRAEVNAGRFRADLYFRLAVLRITMPPLRQRPEDLPSIVEQLVADLGVNGEAAARLCSAETLARFQAAAWPGNVRELRNAIERYLVFEETAFGTAVSDAPAAAPAAWDGSLPYAEARRLALEEFERRYVEDLLARHGGRVAHAAVAAGVDRAHLYKILRRRRRNA